MKDALLLGRLDDFGPLLDEAWHAKKEFSSKISDAQIDELYALAKQNGAIGGKLLGAGGGGFLLLFCEFDKRHRLARNLEERGGKIVDFALASQGLQTWEVTQDMDR